MDRAFSPAGDVAIEAALNVAMAAKLHFLRTLELARQQEALSRELRAAMSFARLRRWQGNTGGSQELLAAVYEKFHAGLDTTDLRNARHLLDELAYANRASNTITRSRRCPWVQRNAYDHACAWPETKTACCIENVHPDRRQGPVPALHRRFAGRAKWRINAPHAEERKGRE